MLVKEIMDILGAEVLCGADRLESTDIKTAFASDMMSDVLAFVNDQCLLLTGLVNPQVVRTAEMMDIQCILFVRGKKPDLITVALAEEKSIIILSTPLKMYAACGALYVKGLPAGN